MLQSGTLQFDGIKTIRTEYLHASNIVQQPKSIVRRKRLSLITNAWGKVVPVSEKYNGKIQWRVDL